VEAQTALTVLEWLFNQLGPGLTIVVLYFFGPKILRWYRTKNGDSSGNLGNPGSPSVIMAIEAQTKATIDGFEELEGLLERLLADITLRQKEILMNIQDIQRRRGE